MADIEEIYRQSIGEHLRPIHRFLSDESVTEVMINGPHEVFIERRGKIEKTDAVFGDAFDLEAAMRNIAQYVGKRITREEFSIEARLPDGSRVHIVLPPASRKGISVSIRKFSRQSIDLAQLVQLSSLTDQAAEFLSVCVEIAKNIIVSGGTGSGKTTLLNCLSGKIPPNERIIVIEDSSELQLQQPHVVPFEAQARDKGGKGGITIRELFRASLRMRPDRIIVGECRGGEALDMIQAMTSGHSGSMSTVHANTPRDALSRIETMALMGDVEIPLYALRSQVASATQIVVQIGRFHDGRRRITQITEVLPLTEQFAYALADLFTIQEATDQNEQRLEWTKVQPTFWREAGSAHALNVTDLTSEIWKKREPQ